MARRVLFVVVRVVVAAAVCFAVVRQLITSLDFWRAGGVENVSVYVVNFFSFFTVEANLIAAAAALIGGAFLVAGRMPDPRWFLVLRLCATAYIATTGIVYNLLLRGIELPQGSTDASSNELLHVVVPVLVVLDWLFAPGRRCMSFKAVWIVAIYPIVWVGYTLVRGPLTPDPLRGVTTWYPYPFLDPSLSPLGYWSVAIYVVAIAVVICGLGALFVWVSRTFGGDRAGVDAAAA
ncbi:MAG TPA: Pr6Pr family membrane protein [Humibacter sp.]|nr:Pr6Pr family membrane protein [Humibacter sp.]